MARRDIFCFSVLIRKDLDENLTLSRTIEFAEDNALRRAKHRATVFHNQRNVYADEAGFDVTGSIGRGIKLVAEVGNILKRRIVFFTFSGIGLSE